VKYQNQLQGASNAITSMQRLLSSSEQDADPTLATTEGAAAAAAVDKARCKLERIKLLLPEKVRERESIKRSIQQLHADNYELRSLQESEVAVTKAWERLGLTEAIASMSTNVRAAGKSRNNRGASFEELSERIIHDNLLPNVARQLGVPVTDLFLVRNVCFGMGSSPGRTGEFDILMCTRADTFPDCVPMPRGGTFCHVHGVGKSNIVPYVLSCHAVTRASDTSTPRTFTLTQWKSNVMLMTLVAPFAPTRKHSSGFVARRAFTTQPIS
jgi:hypothetical protein